MSAELQFQHTMFPSQNWCITVNISIEGIEVALDVSDITNVLPPVVPLGLCEIHKQFDTTNPDDETLADAWANLHFTQAKSVGIVV